jgi:hypothetical protein
VDGTITNTNQDETYRIPHEWPPGHNRFPDHNDLADIHREQRESGLREYFEQDLDRNKFPGGGCPDRQPPSIEDQVGWIDYTNKQIEANISGRILEWDAATIQKVASALDTNVITQDPFGTPEWEEDYDGDDSGNEDDEDDWGMIHSSEEEDPTEDDAEEDPEPEGDDPDELRSPVSEEIFRSKYASRAESSGTGGSGTDNRGGSGQQGSMPQGTGFPKENHGRLGLPKDPEGGGPDNVEGGVINPAVASTGVAGSINRSARSSAAESPAVGNPGDPQPPPRPEAVKRASPVGGATSANTSHLSAVAWRNPDNPPPPRPEFAQ